MVSSRKENRARRGAGRIGLTVLGRVTRQCLTHMVAFAYSTRGEGVAQVASGGEQVPALRGQQGGQCGWRKVNDKEKMWQ